MEVAGLRRKIESAGPFTIFAPTDQAILGTKLASQIDFATRNKLRRVLEDHIVVGEFSWEQLAGRRSVLISLSGSKLAIDGQVGIRIGRSRITNSDVLAANGVLHIVDAVIEIIHMAMHTGNHQQSYACWHSPYIFQHQVILYIDALETYLLDETNVSGQYNPLSNKPRFSRRKTGFFWI